MLIAMRLSKVNTFCFEAQYSLCPRKCWPQTMDVISNLVLIYNLNVVDKNNTIDLEKIQFIREK